MNLKAYVTPFIFGLIGIFSFAPYSIKPLIFFSYAYLIRELVFTNNQRFIKLILWSFAHWGFGMSWLIVSVYYYGETTILISALIYIILVILLSGVFSAPLYFLSLAQIQDQSKHKILNILAIVSVFIVNEWTMNYLLWGVPWLISGLTLIDTFAQKVYPFLGVAAASFLVYLIAALIAASYKSNKKLFYVYSAISCIFLVPFNEPIKKNSTNDLSFSIIQPSTDPFLKYEDGYAEKIEDNIYKLIAKTPENTELIILPEAELPYSYQDNRFINFRLNVPENIIMGSWSYEKEKLFNSMINLSNNHIYNKVHLVPFGEFIPFNEQLRGLISFFDMPMSYVNKGNNTQMPFKLEKKSETAISPLICFDIAFSETVRKSNISSKFMVNISNDTWFGNSIGPYQHLDIARARAIENNKWLIRSANDGISAIIDNNGTIVDKLSKGERGVLNGTLQFIDEPSFYSKFGHGIILVLSSLILGICVIINLCKKYLS
jgi:apolipoprotein N-acyltransferase